MRVEPVSKIEQAKMCYAEDSSGFCFSKWLTLLIAIQITWTRLKIQFKELRNPFIYLYEEKLWYISAVVDSFIPSNVNSKVISHYGAMVID